MLTLEMIRKIKKEDRNFWLNKCTAKELKEVVKNWGDRKLKSELGYSCKFKKAEIIEFIEKIISYEEQKVIDEYFENIKKASEPKVAEQLSKGDNITDLKLKYFYYDFIKNYYEEDINLRELNDSWKVLFNQGQEELARKYYKGLIRYFHSDTSKYADTEMFNIVKDTYKNSKEEYEYYKNLDDELDDDFDFSDIEINVNTNTNTDDSLNFDNDDVEYEF